jgi:hypothetical protein
MAGTRKCAHPACSYVAPDKQKYCSQMCQDSKNVTALACHCDHPGLPRGSSEAVAIVLSWCPPVGSNRDYLVGATMIVALSGQDCTLAKDTAAGQTIPSPYAVYRHLNGVEVSHERATRERCSR